MSEQQSEFDQLAVEAESLTPVAAVATSQSVAPEGPPTAEIIFPVVSMAFDLVAPNWAVGEGEKKALSEAYGALLDKYFPDAINSFGVELQALLITAAIVAPRLRVPRRVEDHPREEAKAA